MKVELLIIILFDYATWLKRQAIQKLEGVYRIAIVIYEFK